jgi:hypothetical protein
MSSEQRTWFEGAMLGLAIVAAGCADDKGNNEEETGTEGDGDGDTGNPDTGNPDTGNPETGDGDTGPNDIPLELELAVFNKTGKYLLLRFSEPMAPVDGIDPSDFRVSLATTWQYFSAYYGYVYKSSNYWDPNTYLGYEYYYYGYGYKPLVADLIANGSQPTDIVLRFVDELEEGACQQFVNLQASYADYDAQPNADAKIGLFPHYSPGAVPVESADGEVLAAIGPEWAEFPGQGMSLYYEFGWPNLDPQIEIPCTVGIDP